MKFVLRSQDSKLSKDNTFAATYNETGATCPTSCIFHPTAGKYAQEKRNQYGRNTVCYTNKGRTNWHQAVAGLVDAVKLRKSVADFLNLRIAKNGKGNVIAKKIVGMRWHVSGDIMHDGVVSGDYVDAILWSIEKLRAVGVRSIGYTHAWYDDTAKKLQKYFMASCDTPEEVLQALDDGWMCTLLVDKDNLPTPEQLGGSKLTICPNQLTDGRVKCADCMLCSPSSLPKFNQKRVIGFIYH